MPFFRRALTEPLLSPTSRDKVRLLFGARQTGKTALLRNLMPTEETFYLDLGVSADRRRYEADPGVFAREVRALPKRIRHVIVDEIQKVPELLDEVQTLYDGERSGRQFFLTGSSARRLRRQSANLLPGRCHVFRLSPVTLWETERTSRFEEPSLQPPRPPKGAAGPFPARSLEQTLLFGQLPGIRQESDEAAAATLAAYVENYLEEEIRREAVVRTLGPFGVFLKLAAIESGGSVNVAKLSQRSGLPASSLKSYYEVLVDTFTGHWVRPYTRAGRKRLLTAPRFLMFDVGVRNAAAGLPLEPGMLSTEGPRLLEHWVGLELIGRAAIRGGGHAVTFWRTVSGAEVDFVWETPGADLPIEVKWTERPQPTDARHLEAFLETYPKRARRGGLLICRCPRAQQLTERVTAVPWDAF